MKIVATSLFAILSAVSVSNVAQAQSFDGPSVGVQAGWVKNDVRNPKTDIGKTSLDASKGSPSIGILTGYDKQIGKFVVGGEAGINFGTSDTVKGVSGTNQMTINPKRSIDLTARAGIAVMPDTLVYVRGGYTNDRIHSTLTSATGTTSASEDRDGWLVGGGIEHKLTQRVSARLEYRYADLSNGSGKYDRHQVLAGAAFHF